MFSTIETNVLLLRYKNKDIDTMNFVKLFSKFYHRHSELIVKYNIGLKTLLQQCISESVFYGHLINKFKRILGKHNFSDQF